MCPGVYPENRQKWGIGYGAPRKTSFAGFSRCPAGLVYWGRGLTINGLRYSGTCPFLQTPIPLRFFDVLYGPHSYIG